MVLLDSVQYAMARSRPELFAYQFVVQAEPAGRSGGRHAAARRRAERLAVPPRRAWQASCWPTLGVWNTGVPWADEAAMLQGRSAPCGASTANLYQLGYTRFSCRR